MSSTLQTLPFRSPTSQPAGLLPLSASHRCLPDFSENRKTEIAMEANETLLQMKYARIIEQIAADLSISNVDAMDLFYNSRTFQLISQGIADLHCRSDRYLAEEVERENETHSFSFAAGNKEG